MVAVGTRNLKLKSVARPQETLNTETPTPNTYTTLPIMQAATAPGEPDSKGGLKGA